MLDREMGHITDELQALAGKCGMSTGELESTCRMWFEQYGQGWYNQALSVMKERARAVDKNIPGEIARVLAG